MMTISDLITTNLAPADFYQYIAQYIFAERTRNKEFIISPEAAELYEAFLSYLKKQKVLKRYQQSITSIAEHPPAQFQLIRQWVHAFIQQTKVDHYQQFLNEVAVLLMIDKFNKKQIIHTITRQTIPNLQGDHTVLNNGEYTLDYVAFSQKLQHFVQKIKSQYDHYHQLKRQLTDKYRQQMRLEEFKPRVLSSFVRNQLIDKVYLPIIGDNLAKQIGTADANTRTDRMGLLLLISPPGYGKTTLMEYIANRLGLIFMKINGPAIGHEVTAVDPAYATNMAAKQELKKLNLALEMGDNIMLYLDDIQHCNPAFLQKFISLCDAQRKIEGVYKGIPKTYDLRGKRVAIVMAGNPYTESGDKFQIPDMLANRADIYNLGDIIGDNAKVFKMSYLENALTSNKVLARLAGKSLKDVHTLVQVATTGQQESLNLEGNHSPEDLNEYIILLKKMLRARDVILMVNQEYIRSAAMSDDYRTEPSFKLQGSYRDMNKLAEKIIPIMNKEELETLILSHYEGESQTLTSNAEANFLKLKELMGILTAEELERWIQIKQMFNQKKGSNLSNNSNSLHPLQEMIGQINSFNEEIRDIKKVIRPY